MTLMMNHSGTFQWHIDDPTLINKILSAKCGDIFESDEVFQVGKLNWKIQLCPNGASERGKGYCGVGARLLEMPSSWKSIFCQLHIECPQIQRKIVMTAPYCTPRGWRSFISSFEGFQAACGAQITFVVTIRIARITLKEDNKIWFQMPTNRYKTKTQIQWKIDEQMMK
eukprot:134136_1